jgi:high affinity Mn2+ porin
LLTLGRRRKIRIFKVNVPIDRTAGRASRVIASAGLGRFDGPAIAADMPLRAPVTGFCVGGEAGYGGGNLAYAVSKDFTFTADYQLIANPAYNADRGPASIFSGRLHGEF